MKKHYKVMLIVLSLMVLLVGCGNSSASNTVVNTYDVTDMAHIEENMNNGVLVTSVRYYEMSDGMWKTDSHSYKYRLEITGRLANAAKDSTFVYLSNIKDISFEQAWKAAGLSSNLDDYFDEKDAVLVATK